MAKKKTTAIKPRPVAVETAARPSAILPFLEKRSLVLAIALIALGTLRIVSTYSETFVTWDEPGHMACGLQYLAEHVYRYEPQHPPLGRAAAALLPFVFGARPTHVPNQDQEGISQIYSSGNPAGMLTEMRLGILPFFILASAMVYLWARRHFGPAAAVLSVALFTLTPTMLAHAGLATIDMPLAAGLIAAWFALLLWAEEPTWRNSVLLGLATALGTVSKFTMLGFFPVAAFFAVIAWFAVARPSTADLVAAVKMRAVPFVVAVAVGAFAIWAVYLFTWGTPRGWNFSVPAPALFEGIDFARYHNSKGHAAYFLGEIRNTGWWYFFPLLLLLKTPLGILALAIAGQTIAFRRLSTFKLPATALMPLAFFTGILGTSMTSHVNIGLRHMLPIFASLAVLGGIALVALLELAPRKQWAGALAAALLLWIAVSGALRHPNYLAYFNELVGDRPERVVTDSDLDWGQDTIRLARRLRELGATQVNYFTLNVSSNRLMQWPGLPNVRPILPLQLAEGWTAVHPTIAIVDQYGLRHRDPRLLPWFTYYHPQERVGSLLLYYIPPGTLRR